MRKSILMAVFALASLTIVSCDKKSNNDAAVEQGHVHEEGEAAHESDSSGSPHSGHNHKDGEASHESDTTANHAHKEGDGHDHAK